MQVDRQYGIDRSAIVSISTNNMQTPTKTAPPPFKVKTPPDFVGYTELPPAMTPTFATVLKTYGIAQRSLKMYNEFLLHSTIDWDSQRPDGVLYLKDGGRKRHLASHKVRYLFFCSFDCI